MSVINCLPRNDAAISRDRCKPPTSYVFLLPRPIFSPSISSDPSLSSLCSSHLCAPRVFVSFVRTSLARPAPPFHLFRFFHFFLSFFLFFDRQRGLVMHLNNLFISDSTLRATQALGNNERKTFPRAARTCR